MTTSHNTTTTRDYQQQHGPVHTSSQQLYVVPSRSQQQPLQQQPTSHHTHANKNDIEYERDDDDDDIDEYGHDGEEQQDVDEDEDRQPMYPVHPQAATTHYGDTSHNKDAAVPEQEDEIEEEERDDADIMASMDQAEDMPPSVSSSSASLFLSSSRSMTTMTTTAQQQDEATKQQQGPTGFNNDHYVLQHILEQQSEGLATKEQQLRAIQFFADFFVHKTDQIERCVMHIQYYSNKEKQLVEKLTAMMKQRNLVCLAVYYDEHTGKIIYLRLIKKKRAVRHSKKNLAYMMEQVQNSFADGSFKRFVPKLQRPKSVAPVATNNVTTNMTPSTAVMEEHQDRAIVPDQVNKGVAGSTAVAENSNNHDSSSNNVATTTAITMSSASPTSSLTMSQDQTMGIVKHQDKMRRISSGVKGDVSTFRAFWSIMEGTVNELPRKEYEQLTLSSHRPRTDWDDEHWWDKIDDTMVVDPQVVNDCRQLARIQGHLKRVRAKKRNIERRFQSVYGRSRVLLDFCHPDIVQIQRQRHEARKKLLALVSTHKRRTPTFTPGRRLWKDTIPCFFGNHTPDQPLFPNFRTVVAEFLQKHGTVDRKAKSFILAKTMATQKNNTFVDNDDMETNRQYKLQVKFAVRRYDQTAHPIDAFQPMERQISVNIALKEYKARRALTREDMQDCREWALRAALQKCNHGVFYRMRLRHKNNALLRNTAMRKRFFALWQSYMYLMMESLQKQYMQRAVTLFLNYDQSVHSRQYPLRCQQQRQSRTKTAAASNTRTALSVSHGVNNTQQQQPHVAVAQQEEDDDDDDPTTLIEDDDEDAASTNNNGGAQDGVGSNKLVLSGMDDMSRRVCEQVFGTLDAMNGEQIDKILRSTKQNNKTWALHRPDAFLGLIRPKSLVQQQPPSLQQDAAKSVVETKLTQPRTVVSVQQQQPPSTSVQQPAQQQAPNNTGLRRIAAATSHVANNASQPPPTQQYAHGVQAALTHHQQRDHAQQQQAQQQQAHQWHVQQMQQQQHPNTRTVINNGMSFTHQPAMQQQSPHINNHYRQQQQGTVPQSMQQRTAPNHTHSGGSQSMSHPQRPRQ